MRIAIHIIKTDSNYYQTDDKGLWYMYDLNSGWVRVHPWDMAGEEILVNTLLWVN